MKEQPLVSVLMTSYNREKYIAEAIESVLASTYANWELIIVDDGSKDTTLAIAKKYAARDERIFVYKNEVNLGDYPNRNKAASYAKGKYLKYLDADDIIYPHGLEVMVRSIEQFPEAGYALCKPDSTRQPLPLQLQPEEAFQEHFFVKHVFTNSPLGAIIRRDAFEKVGGFSGKRYIGDAELWMKLALYYPMVKMVMGLGFWRGHGDQEFVKGTVSNEYPVLEYALLNDILADKRFPLVNKKALILKKYKHGQLSKIIKTTPRNPQKGIFLLKTNQINFGDFVSFFKEKATAK